MVARTYICVVCKNSNVQQYVCFELCREHVWPLRWKFVGDLAGSLIAIGENITSFPPLVAWWPAPWHV